jgi:hypothetical protein
MSIQAPRSFRLPTTVLLLLLILLMEEMMTMITVATMNLLIQLILLGPALKARPVLGDHPVHLVPLAKALWVEVVVEVAAMVMVVWQVLPAGPRLRIPTSVFLFRRLPRFGMPSTSGIGILQLLVLQSRISGIRTPLTVPIRLN